MKTDKLLKLLSVVESFSAELYRHSTNVAVLSAFLGRAISFSEEETLVTVAAALLHDLGKAKLDKNIIFKPGPLTESEFQMIKKHPSLAVEMIKDDPSLSQLCPIILYHHERWDAKGYFGLEKENIPLPSRVLAIADSFDAMVSSRPYRKTLSQRQARKEIARCAGTQFDPVLAEIFIEAIRPLLEQEWPPEAILNIITRERVVLADLFQRYGQSHPLVFVQSQKLDRLVSAYYEAQNQTSRVTEPQEKIYPADCYAAEKNSTGRTEE